MTYLNPIGTLRWTNYHRTLLPEELLNGWEISGAGPAGPAAYFKATADEIGQLLARAATDGSGLRPVGAAWSFSGLLKGGTTLFKTQATDSIYLMGPTQKGPAAGAAPLVLVSAGTTVRNLNRRLEPLLSLRTSGAHDGQTVGGLLGTGTHGSVLGYGAFQNQVRGVHLVTAPGHSVWIERGPSSILAPAFVQQFASAISLDPDTFDAVLVHLGGLGVLNAVLLEVTEGYMLDVVRQKKRLGFAQLRLLEAGRFREFADWAWPLTDRDPYYLEVILNPYHAYSEAGGAGDANALITLFFKIPWLIPKIADQEYPPAEDVLNLLQRGGRERAELFSPGEWAFKAVANEFKVTVDPERKTWGQANGPHEKMKVGPLTIELFNAAYALRRDQLLTALPVMLSAFNSRVEAPGVFTLRFVSAAAGLMSFTSFPETVVVNLDGARNFGLCEAAAKDVALALERNHLPFCQHWGKQGEITPSRFLACYGKLDGPKSRAAKWLAVRNALLSPAMRQVIRNADLVRWGLA